MADDKFNFRTISQNALAGLFSYCIHTSIRRHYVVGLSVRPVFHLALSNMVQRHVAFCEHHVALHERHVVLLECHAAVHVRHVAHLILGQ